MQPGLEGHGGSTYCSVASLALMNSLHEIDLDSLLDWCIMSQGHGFTGRPEKPPDSCYSYWIGAVLNILGGLSLCNDQHKKSSRVFFL